MNEIDLGRSPSSLISFAFRPSSENFDLLENEIKELKAQLEKTERESGKSALEESTKWKEKVDGLNSELTKYVPLSLFSSF